MFFQRVNLDLYDRIYLKTVYVLKYEKKESTDQFKLFRIAHYLNYLELIP